MMDKKTLDGHVVRGVLRTVEDGRPKHGWVFTRKPDAIELKDQIDSSMHIPFKAKIHQRHVRAGGLSLPVYVVVCEQRM